MNQHKMDEDKLELFTIIMHDIKSPLRFISTITQELANNYLLIDKQTLQHHLIAVNNSVKSLQQYCAIIHNWQMHVSNSTITIPIKLNELFIDIKEVYSPLIQFKHIKFDVIETDIYCYIQKETLFTIIINLIDNAYKYTQTGFIKLYAIADKNACKIIVSDSGKGMNEDRINLLLDGKAELSSANLGYIIIIDLLKKIKGTIKITSTLNVGTTVIITLPNPEKHDNIYLG